MIKSRRLAFIISALGSLLAGCSQSATEKTPDLLVTNNRTKDDMVIVFVPKADFKLSERGRWGDGNHFVSLDSFWIDRTEITNSQYKKCVDAGDCIPLNTCSWGDPTYSDSSFLDHPAVCVSWGMASTYCQWVGGRLPSEAEWDFAARGPKRYNYTWGNKFEPEGLNYCDVNCSKSDSSYNDGYETSAPVGTYPGGMSWCGALDMNGNVWEWVFDWYAPYTSDTQENPMGPPTGTEKVLRGGSWYDLPDFLKADHRHPFDPDDNNHLVGFRCVVPIP